MADLQQTMGSVIRRERQALHMTLKELAERAILSVVYLGEIERGKKYPSAIVLERLAGALDMDVPDLLHLVADELSGIRQPALTIGFGLPARQEESRPRSTGGTIINMLVA